jgi:hypothetical protein
MNTIILYYVNLIDHFILVIFLDSINSKDIEYITALEESMHLLRDGGFGDDARDVNTNMYQVKCKGLHLRHGF